MNETVKGLLMEARISAKSEVQFAEAGLRRARDRISDAEGNVAQRRQHLADLDAALTEDGVDLVAEDAKAAARNVSGADRYSQFYRDAGFGRSLADVGTSAAQSARALSEADSALARAMDEA